MKQKLSITLEEETVALMESKLKDCSFRNKSHLIEFAVREMIKDD